MAIKSETQMSTGLRSLELMYEPVSSSDLKDVVAYRSELRINNPDIGVILPAQYMPIALRSQQCCRLARWALENIVEAMLVLNKREAYYDWVSVHIPVKYLKDKEFIATFKEIIKDKDVETRKLCFEVPAEILYEEPSEMAPVINELKILGIRMLISEFGGAFCPVLRLQYFDVYGIVTAPDIAAALEDETKFESILSVLEMVKSQEKQIVLTGINSAEIEELADENGCTLTTGKIAGNQRKLSYIR